MTSVFGDAETATSIWTKVGVKSHLDLYNERNNNKPFKMLLQCCLWWQVASPGPSKIALYQQTWSPQYSPQKLPSQAHGKFLIVPADFQQQFDDQDSRTSCWSHCVRVRKKEHSRDPQICSTVPEKPRSESMFHNKGVNRRLPRKELSDFFIGIAIMHVNVETYGCVFF